jgi:hypothetical protein
MEKVMITEDCKIDNAFNFNFLYLLKSRNKYIFFLSQRETVTADYNKYNPDHRQIYKFIRTLFNAAQLTAECAIITLVYLERSVLSLMLPTATVNLQNFPALRTLIRTSRYRTVPVYK